MLSLILTLAAKSLGTYAVGAAGVALTHLVSLIKAKTHNAALGGVLDRSKDLALQVAKEMLATDMTKAGAMDALKRHLGATGLADLAKVVGSDTNAEKLLGTLLEAATHTAQAEVVPRDGISVPPPTTGFPPLPTRLPS